MKTVTATSVEAIANKLNINFADVREMSIAEISKSHYAAYRKSSNDFTGSKAMVVDFWSKCIGLKMVKAI